MCFHRGGVDQHLSRWAAGRSERMEDVQLHPFGRPPHKAIIEHLARAIDLRRISPAATGLQHMHNAADDPSLVSPWLASGAGRQMRRKPGELPVLQPEMILIHCRSPFGNLESENALRGNPVYGSGP